MSRQKADLWKQLVAEAGEDEIERAASVSVRQAEKELAAAGFDVAAERARASAFLEALERGGAEEEAPAPKPSSRAIAVVAAGANEPPPKMPERSRSRPRPAIGWLATAAVLLGAGGLAYVALHPSPHEPTAPSPNPPGAPSTADVRAAADLRRQAAGACDARQWVACLADLDRARSIDPAGDEAPSAKSLRARAREGQDKTPGAPRQ